MDFNKAIEHRNFQGVFIPADLYLNTNLTWTEKILIIEINSLDKEIDGVRQGCFAGNDYLAAFLDKEANSIANIITDLRNRNIVIDRKKFDGRRRYIGIDFEAIKSEPKRIKAVKLRKDKKITDSQKSESLDYSQNNEGSSNKKVKPAITKKLEQLSQNNEHINTTINTTIKTDYNLQKEAENKFSTESDYELLGLEEKEKHSEKNSAFVYGHGDQVETQQESIEEQHLDPMPKLLEEICIENDFDAIPMFPKMPKADWIVEKIKAFGRSGFIAVLQEIEGYSQRTPNYIGGKVQCLAKVFNQFAKTKEDKFETQCKQIISDKYKELTGEGLESAKSDAKHLKDLIGKMRKSITEITGNEATEKEILAGLTHIMKKLPAEFCNVAKFKIPLIAHNYQQIKLQIKNGTGTNNTNNKKSVTGNAELDARLANNYGQGIGNIDPIYGF
jgi:hypothetical protein